MSRIKYSPPHPTVTGVTNSFARLVPPSPIVGGINLFPKN